MDPVTHTEQSLVDQLETIIKWIKLIVVPLVALAVAGAVWATKIEAKVTDLDRGQTHIIETQDLAKVDRLKLQEDLQRYREGSSERLAEIQNDVKWIKETLQKRSQ